MLSRIEVRFDSSETALVFAKDESVPSTLWARVREAALQAYPDALDGPSQIRLPWANGLVAVRELAGLQRILDFRLAPVGDAAARIATFREEFTRARAATVTARSRRTRNEIEARLRDLGFTKRRLTEPQVRDVIEMLTLPHGANFSVPGAGKTTVVFAVHLLLHDVLPKLLVIAPKNAFGAWDDVIVDCIEDGVAPSWATQRFVRLVNDDLEIERLLRSDHSRFIINYERLIRLVPLLQSFLLMNRVHVVIDESHRIKGGEARQRGQAVLRLSPFASRRDILSGTPAPHSVTDLGPQLEFLWPGTGLGDRVVQSSNPGTALQGLFVRTTKAELGIAPAHRHFVHVRMSEPQAALYGLLKSEFLRRYGRERVGGAFDAFRARNNAVRLLQASTNPVLAARGIDQAFPEDDNAAAIGRAVILDGDSPKIVAACDMARAQAAQGRKTIIWTVFRETIERVKTRLIDLNPIELHGGIPTGDPQDPATREALVRRFHKDSGSMVVIANAAACSEGISLHRVCHVAIYIDRNYNAAYYLQSIDRIHRLGIPPDIDTNVYILQSMVPDGLGSIDHSISRRLGVKIRTMNQILNDRDLHELALDEEAAEMAVDYDMTLEDLYDLVEQLVTGAVPSDEEAE